MYVHVSNTHVGVNKFHKFHTYMYMYMKYVSVYVFLFYWFPSRGKTQHYSH